MGAERSSGMSEQLLTAKATLVTRCGCWKHVDVPWPPNKELIVPLKPRQSASVHQSEGPSKPFMETRRFELKDAGRHGIELYADYEEVSA